jgi:two-component system alkaline phosphatase synthesis response regulator PhoP
MKKRVLLVDDDEDFIALTKPHIERGGYDVDVAYEGEEALAKARTGWPDVIVLDVMMPGLNGYDVCTELKTDAAIRHIPVILLTAVASQVPQTTYTHRQGMESEADDYIAKPVRPEELLKAIGKIL